VVFGAAGRLTQAVGDALKYYDADMFIVSDGCVSQIVGDDIEEVVRGFEGSEKPVLHASLPGFKGNNLFGHSEILRAIIEQYLKKSDHIHEKQVNIWGIVPFYDTLWVATLEKLEALLAELGFEPNIIYGRGKGLKAVDKIPSAGFNLLLSPWVDLDIVKLLEEKLGTPYFHYPNLPIGPTQTADFVRKLVKYAGLDEVGAERVIKREEDRYYYYLNHSIRFIFTCRVTPREFYINSSASQALALTKYLINDLGMTPRKIFISEGVPEELQGQVRAYFNDVEYEHPEEIEVIFTNDGGLCDTYVKSEDTAFRKTAVFGTTWDELTAKTQKLPFVPVSAPYGDLMVGAKTYFAWEGGINLAADLYNDAANKGLGTVS
jgi:nitrogenase molybdenum-iron protein beta chain